MQKYIFYIAIALYPITFLPLFPNPLETPKVLVLLLTLLSLITATTINLLSKNEVKFNRNKLDFAVFIFMFAYFLSSVFSPTNKIDAFLIPGGSSLVILSGFFYLFLSKADKREKKTATFILLSAGFLIAIMQIISFLGIAKAVPFMPEITRNPSFTPFGNIFGSLIIFVSLLPVILKMVVNRTDISEKILFSLVGLVYLFGIATNSAVLIKNRSEIKILNANYGWSIAVDALKINPLFGSGPSNFNQAFNSFKSVRINLAKDWSTKYVQSTSTLLTIFTETGVLGLIAFLFMIFNIFKNQDFKDPVFISLSVYSLAFIFMPLTYVSFFIFFTLLAIYKNNKMSETEVTFKSNQRTRWFVASITTIIVITFLYLGYKGFAGEIYLSKSLSSISQNKGVEAYNYINKAVSLNPYSDRYHLLSAQINLALASSIAKNENLGDEEKQNISKLIQQSIREAKAAVSVSKFKSSNWDALSDVYQAIIPFAKGSDTFAIQTLNQAIALDPVNPLLRLKLGQIYYSLKNYDAAIESYKVAVIAKSDWANAHYNLGLAYKENKQTDKAKEEINTTLSLLGKDSVDYNTALRELQSLDELTTPQDNTTNAIEPKLDLPQESQPQQ